MNRLRLTSCPDILNAKMVRQVMFESPMFSEVTFAEYFLFNDMLIYDIKDV